MALANGDIIEQMWDRKTTPITPITPDDNPNSSDSLYIPPVSSSSSSSILISSDTSLSREPSLSTSQHITPPLPPHPSQQQPTSNHLNLNQNSSNDQNHDHHESESSSQTRDYINNSLSSRDTSNPSDACSRVCSETQEIINIETGDVEGYRIDIPIPPSTGNSPNSPNNP